MDRRDTVSHEYLLRAIIQKQELVIKNQEEQIKLLKSAIQNQDKIILLQKQRLLLKQDSSLIIGKGNMV